MKSIPDVQVEDNSDTSHSSAGGGGGGTKVWTISGRLLVRESEIDGASHDRPLKGVEVEVSASDISASGPWSDWGSGRTDADGDWSVSESNNGASRFLRVRARFLAADLELEDPTLGDIGHLDLTDKNWRTVWRSNGQLSGPAVSVGTRVFASGQPEDLGDAMNRRRAVVWYTLRTALDRLKAEDPWLAIAGKVIAVYPARSVIGSTYNDGQRIFLAQADPDVDWHPDVVLGQLMLRWFDEHTHGSRKLSGWPSAHLALGFAGFGSTALCHELWGLRLWPPFNRRAVATTLELSTLDEIDDDDRGAMNVFHLLAYGERRGWWSHLLGTAQAYPDNRPDDNGNGLPDHADEVGVKQRLDGRVVPGGKDHLSLWDILHAFRADPSRGWTTDLDVGKPSDGVMAFVERAISINALDDDVLAMLRDCIDPLGTKEPYEWLPKP